MSSKSNRFLIKEFEFFIMALFIFAFQGCSSSFCLEMERRISREDVQNYINIWIETNILNKDLSGVFFAEVAIVGDFGIRKEIDLSVEQFDWEILGFSISSKLGEIELFGDSLENIEAVYFGEGFRKGVIVSLRGDGAFPTGKLDRICSSSENFAVFYNSRP